MSEPPIGRQRGIESQHFSPRPKTKRRRAPIPKRAAMGAVFPFRTSETRKGEAIKKKRVTKAKTTFWAVRFCTSVSVRNARMGESRKVENCDSANIRRCKRVKVKKCESYRYWMK